MEANKPTSLQDRKKKSQAGFFLDMMFEIFPDISLDEAWPYAFELSQSPQANKYEKLFVELDDTELTSKESFKNLQNMRKAGFSVKHMLLYLEAPMESSFGEHTTKEELLTLWAAEKDFAPQKPQGETMGRVGVATKGLLAILGTATILGGVAAGITFQSPALLQTAFVMGQWDFGVVEQATSLATLPSVKTVLSMIATTFGSVMFWNDLKNKIDTSKDVDLRGKLRDGSGGQNKEQLFDILTHTPVSIKHLISHFSPEETCLFLLSDEKTQEKMWRVFPPSFEQRQRSILSERRDQPLLRKAFGHLELSGSTWEPKHENAIVQGPTTLKESLLKLREHKKSLDEAVVEPMLPKPI